MLENLVHIARVICLVVGINQNVVKVDNAELVKNVSHCSIDIGLECG